ncbi:MAG: CoA transferase [Dehalococcoidia bacterium]|nr:CoA transferase [Dehalococcoidia bacterium]
MLGKMKNALDGIRVIEIAQFAAAPATGALLADWGAEVIKIEHPERGDGLRGVMSAGLSTSSLPSASYNYVFETENRNKKSLAINLALKKGQEIVYSLAERSDVFLSNLRPYEIERYGFGYDIFKKLNHRLIYASLTGYGRQGPDRDSPGFDQSAFWARTGLSALLTESGKVPPWPPQAFGDHMTAMATAYGIALALFARERMGMGQEVETSLFGTAVWALSYATQAALTTGQDIRQRRREEGNPLANLYRCGDGKCIALAMIQADRYWSRFCKAIGRPELEQDARFNSLQLRWQNGPALVHILDEHFAKKTRDEWARELSEAGCIYSSVQSSSEVVNDPQAASAGCFADFDHPAFGPIQMLASPVKLSQTPASIRLPAPSVGQHTEEILLELGYSWEDIESLKEQAVLN